MTMPISSNTSPRPSQGSLREVPEQKRIHEALSQLSPARGTTRSPAHDELVQPIQIINETLRPYSVQFVLSEEHSRVVTQLVDLESGQVIRQIPTEAVLQISERLHELSGLLVKERI